MKDITEQLKDHRQEAQEVAGAAMFEIDRLREKLRLSEEKVRQLEAKVRQLDAALVEAESDIDGLKCELMGDNS